jgi:betaine-aldehyde dehydrogenase
MDREDVNTKILVGGELVTASGATTIPTRDPARDKHLADVPTATDRDVDDAIRAARTAFESGWRSSDPAERAAALRAIADCFRDHAEKLTDLEVANNGSTRDLLRDDIDLAVEWLEYYAGLTRELTGETMDTPGNTINFTRREPRGVVVGIVPFNHPLLFFAGRIAAALATGNTIVIKPSEKTPLSTLAFAEYLALEDRVPDGVVNVIAGGAETGEALTGHGDVDMVTFTGSVPVGREVMKNAAAHVSPVMLELGGKNPIVVFPDVDVDRAVEGAVQAMAFSWQGQSCGSGSRAFVHASMVEEFVERTAAAFEEVTVGDPNDPDSDMGAMVSEDHYERVLSRIENGRESGARLVTGGEAADVVGLDGYFIRPTLFTDVPEESTLATEEIFGPVLSVFVWDDYEDLIERVNDVDYGLTASIWTDSLRDAMETADRVEAGYVWVNDHGPHYLGTPFGGVKQSGIGKKHCMEELQAHTQVKNVNVNLGNTDWGWTE